MLRAPIKKIEPSLGFAHAGYRRGAESELPTGSEFDMEVNALS
ncbi:MAG: hypothetical protein ACI9NC_006197 [Verrucomicrobiales bacterium]